MFMVCLPLRLRRYCEVLPHCKDLFASMSRIQASIYTKERTYDALTYIYIYILPYEALKDCQRWKTGVSAFGCSTFLVLISALCL